MRAIANLEAAGISLISQFIALNPTFRKLKSEFQLSKYTHKNSPQVAERNLEFQKLLVNKGVQTICIFTYFENLMTGIIGGNHSC